MPRCIQPRLERPSSCRVSSDLRTGLAETEVKSADQRGTSDGVANPDDQSLVQIFQKLEEINERAREIQHQLEDLHNYDFHITEVVSELRDYQGKGNLELAKAFDAAE